MQSPPDSKSTPALMAYGRLCQWLPTDHDIHRIHEVQLGFQERVVRLMFAQAFVLCGSSAVLFFSDDCQASFRFVPASRALSLAGLLTQFAFYHGIPPQITKLFTFTRTEETRSRAVVFYASMWIPFMPFVLSIILLCFGTNDGACYNTAF